MMAITGQLMQKRDFIHFLSSGLGLVHWLFVNKFHHKQGVAKSVGYDDIIPFAYLSKDYFASHFLERTVHEQMRYN